jgi:diguanylate cyclase (GGDEF)-like protein
MTEKTVVKYKEDIFDDDHVRLKKPCLTVLKGLYVGEVFQLEKKSILIGRERDCDIVVLEDGVSRKHAQILLEETKVLIQDLESTNGTYINGQKNSRVELQNGDKVQMGDILMKFSYQDAIDVGHQESMRDMAMKDPLTQIYNRRYFMDLFHREISYANRVQQPLSCMMFDLDHFKKINDTFGHQAGDYILRNVAQSVASQLRIYDAFARYGGEEFIIMLRTTTLANAAVLGERIREKIATTDFKFNGTSIPVTISMGMAELNVNAMMTAEELLQETDTCLYEAKERGRNCIVSALNR